MHALFLQYGNSFVEEKGLLDLVTQMSLVTLAEAVSAERWEGS